MSQIQSNATSLTIASSTPPPIVAGQVSAINASGETILKYNPDPTNIQVYKASGGLAGGFASWNSGTYAPDFGGAYGSLISWAGGDGDYWGTEVFAFDIASGTWSRLDEPSKAMDGSGYRLDAGFDSTFFEHVHNSDNSVNDSTRYPNCGGTPSVPHTYDFILCEGASSAYAKGRMIIPQRFATYTQGSTMHAHCYDFSNFQWSRMTSVTPALSQEAGGSCIDTLRKRAWWCLRPGNGAVGYLDISSSASPATAQHYMADVFVERQPVMIYHPGFDAILISAGDFNTGAWGLWYMDPNSPGASWVKLTMSGTTPVPGEYVGLGVCHVYEPTITDPETGRSWDSLFLYQEGAQNSDASLTFNTQKIYKVMAPTSLTGTWTCEPITMGGATVTGGPTYSNGMYKRLTYAKKAKAIMWYSGIDGNVWAYQPAGLA